MDSLRREWGTPAEENWCHNLGTPVSVKVYELHIYGLRDVHSPGGGTKCILYGTKILEAISAFEGINTERMETLEGRF